MFKKTSSKIIATALLAFGLTAAAQATLVSFTGGTVTQNSGSTGVTNNAINWDDVRSYQEAGYRFEFFGTDSAFSSNVGDFYEVGNDVLQGHWATGNFGYLTQIRLTRIDGGAFSLGSFDIVSNTDTGGGPASGNEQVYIHASANGISDDYAQLLASEDSDFPATSFGLGAPFDNVRAIWFDVSGTSDSFGVDNFLLQTVPEPGSLALFGAAAIGLVATRRRRPG
ncbi:PEP-CTERM protein-sorting domain-containing protein [Rhodoferax sp. OV413]|uniref:PEP-CTERM sorting domain-containing protein n=1 Tax=Rhodoferax sp. OV413 TaxID=1855285 RepID=UPI00088C3895|nr:PEP-CTERM sorting domain-containing protein [Rhodoferax sp. OV413]SDP71405.1 PEP-CTERM protein-sorting domain-containing protein [Rhodoferax sp. OV413]